MADQFAEIPPGPEDLIERAFQGVNFICAEFVTIISCFGIWNTAFIGLRIT